MGALKNRLIETVLLSTHNLFWLRNKIFFFFFFFGGGGGVGGGGGGGLGTLNYKGLESSACRMSNYAPNTARKVSQNRPKECVTKNIFFYFLCKIYKVNVVLFGVFLSQSISMVMSRQSVNLTTLFPGKAFLSSAEFFKTNFLKILSEYHLSVK